MKGLLDQASALVVTHVPYWVIAVYMVVVARRMRRSIEAVVRDLNESRDR
jgi:hypothetical protein